MSPAIVADSIEVLAPFSQSHPSNGREKDPWLALTPAWIAFNSST